MTLVGRASESLACCGQGECTVAAEVAVCVSLATRVSFSSFEAGLEMPAIKTVLSVRE